MINSLSSFKKLVWITLCLLINSCSQSITDYDDCILESMKGAASDITARTIQHSCEIKFPDEHQYANKERDLETEEILRLSGQANNSTATSFSGFIYNGNEKITVTSLKIKITTKSISEEKTVLYKIHQKIDAMTTSKIHFQIMPIPESADFEWNIQAATGFNN